MYDVADNSRTRDRFTQQRDRPSRREDFSGGNRRDYNNFGGQFKRGPRRDDQDFNGAGPKRPRFDGASDTFEPEFNNTTNQNAVAPLMTFRKFLMTQDEQITDNAEAIKKYQEYKINYIKEAALRFFEAHKDEQWFQLRYFPGKFEARKEHLKSVVDKRLEVFQALVESSDIDLNLDYTNTENVIRLLDIAIVKLENGTDEDIESVRTEQIVDEALTDLKRLTTIAKSIEENGNGTSGTSKSKQSLHKTTSIRFRNVPASVSVEELETICKQHPGFLRLGFTEPAPGEGFGRKAFASFRRDVNIKEIFWALKGSRVGDVDLQASINRDLRRRVRWVDGIAAHKSVAQNDLKLAAKTIVVLDYKAGLFVDAEDEENAAPPSDLEIAIVRSKNPVLNDITDYLIDETSPEDDIMEELNTGNADAAKVPFERSDEILQRLDRMILYLRIVHSFDFYTHYTYANEDDMPNRISLIHIRGPPPGDDAEKNVAGVPVLATANVEKHITEFTAFFDPILKVEHLSEEELEKLGKQDPEAAVEAFIKENTVEVAPDKWLCPLSGKKFKGPEFIEKHLKSKHQERLDQEQNNAVYFNNYISDPERPQDPEPKPQTNARSPTKTAAFSFGNDVGNGSGDRPRERIIGTERNFNRFGNNGPFGRGNARVFDRGGAGRHQQSYRDLDAPDDA